MMIARSRFQFMPTNVAKFSPMGPTVFGKFERRGANLLSGLSISAESECALSKSTADFLEAARNLRVGGSKLRHADSCSFVSFAYPGFVVRSQSACRCL